MTSALQVPHHGHGPPSIASLHDADTDPRELEAFSEQFKKRRIKLGVSQCDVGERAGAGIIGTLRQYLRKCSLGGNTLLEGNTARRASNLIGNGNGV